MIETHVECTVDAPITEVFDRLVDLPAWSDWLDEECGSDACRFTSEPPIGLGSTYEDTTRMGFVIPGTLAEFEPPEHVVFHNQVEVDGEIAFESRLVYTLRSMADDRTEVVHDFQAHFRGPLAELADQASEGMPVERARISESLRRSFAST